MLISLAAIVLAQSGTTAYAPGFAIQPSPSWVSPAGPPHDAQAEGHRDHEMRELRAEALRVQTKDGGTLTPEHRTEFQNRLEALNRHLARVNN